MLATAYAFQEGAVPVATVVKLARATMIVPIALLFGAWMSLRQEGEGKKVALAGRPQVSQESGHRPSPRFSLPWEGIPLHT